LLILATGGGALASAPWQFGLAQSMVRVAVSTLSSLGVVWLAEHLAPHVRAYGVAIYGAAGSFGAAIAILGLPLAERDWRLPYALSLAGLLLLPVLIRRLEESPLVRSTEPATRILSGLLGVRSLRWFSLAAIAGLFPSAFLAVGLTFTTERLVGDLARDHVAAHLSVAPQDRGAGVVAARLDAEDHAAGCASAAVRHMIRASSLLSW